MTAFLAGLRLGVALATLVHTLKTEIDVARFSRQIEGL